MKEREIWNRRRKWKNRKRDLESVSLNVHWNFASNIFKSSNFFYMTNELFLSQPMGIAVYLHSSSEKEDSKVSLLNLSLVASFKTNEVIVRL